MSAYDDLVERLAKKLAPKAWATLGYPPGHDTPATQNRRTASLRHARAVLSSLHAAGLRIVPEKPTEAIREACADGLKFWLGDNKYAEIVRGDPDNWPGVEPAADQAWTAMLSASPYAPKDK
jgi:hypothetical protein